MLVAFISILFFEMIRAFAMTILLAAIFSGLMSPVHKRTTRAVRGRRMVASALTVLFMFVVIVVPLLVLLTLVAGEAVRLTESVRPWVQSQIHNPQQLLDQLGKIPGIDRIEPYRDPILRKAASAAGGVGNFMVGSLSALTRGTASFFFHLFLFLYSMFYLLVDGKTLLDRVLYYMPLPDEWERRLVDRFVSVAGATIKGTLVIGVLQGALAGFALFLAGIPSALFWTAVMAVLSVVPGVGTALVWVPAAGYLMATGHVAVAVAVVVWCVLVVGSIDNLVRPRLVGRDTKMHDLMILFSTLGGLLVFGLSGFIVGPILAALFVTVWEVYGAAFGDVLPPVGGSESGR